MEKVDVNWSTNGSQMTRVANDSREVSMSKIPLHIKNSVTTMPQGKKGILR